MDRKLVKYILIRLGLLTLALYVFAFVVYKANADEYASFMVGVFSSGKQSLSETKFANAGYRGVSPFGLAYQFEFGGWTDRAGQGRLNSFYGATQIGVEAGDSLVARVMAGPALISQPDSYLGGHYQFTEDFFLGIKGKTRSVVGVKYKHISSAGLEEPNMGRDLLGVEASLRF